MLGQLSAPSQSRDYRTFKLAAYVKCCVSQVQSPLRAGQMQTSSPVNFRHRCNRDGSWDSICVTCFLTVLSTAKEGDLIAAEQSHVCAGPIEAEEAFPRQLGSTRLLPHRTTLSRIDLSSCALSAMVDVNRDDGRLISSRANLTGRIDGRRYCATTPETRTIETD